MFYNLTIPIFFALCFGGLGYVLMLALREGADAYSGEYSEDTARQFEDVFLFIPPKRIAEIGWAIAIAVFITTFLLLGSVTEGRGALVGLTFGSIFGSVALQIPRFLIGVLKRRRLAKFNLQLGDTLMGMSNALRAGFSISQAIESIVNDGERPIAQEFSLFLQQTRVGVSFSDGLHAMDERVSSEDLTLVVTAIETARKTGGNLTEIFEQIASTIRERMRIEKRILTLTAQGRLQGIIVGLMPVFIAGALLVLDPEMMIPFFHSQVGLVIVASVIVLIGLGGLMIRKIIDIDI
jgi:tight adherence protein B